jgi:hypothetical protein
MIGETHTDIVVDGFKYRAGHPNVEEAWEIGMELTKLIGPSAAMMSSVDRNTSQAAVSAVLSEAVMKMLKQIDARTSMVLMKKILRNVECLGEESGQMKRTALDNEGIKMHFHGHVGRMMKLVGHVLVFTHSDFFEAIWDGVANTMKTAGEKAASLE